jgi:hypothetical protein
MLTGDQVGVLLADYLLAHAGDGARLVACSLVSSQLLRFLAAATAPRARDAHRLQVDRQRGDRVERRDRRPLRVGYEEALGYSVGPLVARQGRRLGGAPVRRADGVEPRPRPSPSREHLDDIYRRVGLFVTEQVSLTCPGADGMAAIKRGDGAVPGRPPPALGGVAIEVVADLARGEDGLPPSDVLVFALAEGRRVIMRPSGTEPKLKSYYEVRVPVGADEPWPRRASPRREELARAARRAPGAPARGDGVTAARRDRARPLGRDRLARAAVVVGRRRSSATSTSTPGWDVGQGWAPADEPGSTVADGAAADRRAEPGPVRGRGRDRAADAAGCGSPPTGRSRRRDAPWRPRRALRGRWHRQFPDDTAGAVHDGDPRAHRGRCPRAAGSASSSTRRRPDRRRAPTAPRSPSTARSMSASC